MPSITDSIGRVLGDRYRLVTALGTGASAHVYLADDVSLHRRVAIKVLHPALAGDAAFLKRFQAEARAVAALNHPNILQVFDSGEEGGEPYLVLEYLGGGSLREVYDTGALLTPEQAVQVGIEAAAGLDYAHRRGLVHRDIKPANLLFDDDRRLRISDFGLARALAEASWTEPDGAILGTARYSAPEQVEGWVLDGKADVYALALVLYEGVTGETPFIGDTTVATLMARIGALLPEHKALGPLYDVLVWAAAPEPSERYDASQLGSRLRGLAALLPDPEPLPIVGAVPGGVAASESEDSVRPVRTRTAEPLTELGVPAAVDSPAKPKAKKRAPASAGAKPVRSRRRWLWPVAAAVVAVALVAAGVAYASSNKLFTPSHPVPLLVGTSLTKAVVTVHPDHFAIHPTGHAYSITLPAGFILSQKPTPRHGGTPVTAKQGSAIDVVVSLGLPPVAIPDVTAAVSCQAAMQTLATVHLVGVCPATAAQYSPTVTAGAVLATSPTGTAPYGSTVTIVTSKGHAPVAIPAVAGAGTTYASAAAALTAAGFVPVQHNEYSTSTPIVPKGEVIGTAPAVAAGPQPFGSTVTVIVSLGQQPVTVPNVAGQSVAAATSALQALGLVVAGPYGPPGGNLVLSTVPAAGASEPPGTTVDLYTSF